MEQGLSGVWGLKAGLSPRDMTNRSKPHIGSPALATAALAFVAATLYLPTLFADFAWDSQIQVRYDTFIHDLRNLPAVLSLRVLSMDVLDFNRPTQLLSLMADAALWGKHPFGYHLTSLLLHAAVTVLLFWFCRRLATTWSAFTVALLFAVHPVNCEAVAEVGYREDLLATLFVLAGLNCAAAFGATWRSGVSCGLCLLLAIGAKESAVAAPLLVALYWWWFRRHEPRKPWLWLIATAALLVGGFVAARFALAPEHSAVFTQKPAPLEKTLAGTLSVQARIWAVYFRQTVWPKDLCADYGPYSIRHFDVGLSCLLIVAIIAAQGFGAWRNRVFALGAAIFWLGLLPASNFIPLYRPMADRYLYLPLTGLALMLTPLLARFRIGLWAAVLAAVPLAIVSFQQEKIWRDDVALWTATARTNPASYVAPNNLGCALVIRDRPREAIPHLERAIKLTRGEKADPYAFLALALDALERKPEADEAFKKAVALDARFAQPDLLVKALTCDPVSAEKLKVIAARN